MADDSSREEAPDDESDTRSDEPTEEHAFESKLLRNARAALRSMLAFKPTSDESDASDSS